MSFTHGSHNMFITVWLFISPLFSSFSFGVYNSIHSLGALDFHWNITYGTWLPGYWTFQQIYIRYTLHIDGNSDIFISCGWYSEVYASYFTSILCDCALMSTHFHCIYSLYTVYTECWHSHMGFHVYEMYTYVTHYSTNRYMVYTICIHRVSLF